MTFVTIIQGAPDAQTMFNSRHEQRDGKTVLVARRQRIIL